jgi:phosphoribosylformimino-5-aminoimidazole carboxamide ribotide isomerase
MEILPVLDVLSGQVVRGIAGRRENYRPIESRIAPSCQPLDVARALHAHFGFTEFYLADLDALMGRPPALSIFTELQRAGFRLWVDAGIRTAEDAQPLVDAGVATLMAGLETLAGPDVLADLGRCHGPAHLVFSLDLKAGRPLTSSKRWPLTPLKIVREAVALGIHRILVLDLTRVGVSQGTGTEELCAQILLEHPEVNVAAGGGVRGMNDLERLEKCGVRTALVASALHDGDLRPEEVRRYIPL